MTKDTYNNNSMEIANAITTILTRWNDQEWKKVWDLLYATVERMLYKKGLAQTISKLMREAPKYVVDEVASYLKVRLIDSDMEKLRRFADKTNGDFTRWASINAQGEAYHMYRSEVRRSQRFVSDKDGVEVNLCSTTSVEDAFISRENYQFVAEIINKLPKEQRDALIIKFYRGNPNLSTKELSKKLDISETAFNKRIYDARKNLKKMYA